MAPPASRASILRLLSLTSNQGCRGCGRTHSAIHHSHPPSVTQPNFLSHGPFGLRGMATPVGSVTSGPPPGEGDYAFEVRYPDYDFPRNAEIEQMAASNLRFGAHATREVGMDFTNMLAQLPASERAASKIGVFTDPNVAKLDVMKVVEESLLQEGLNFVVWDKVSVEPTDNSWQVGRICYFLQRTTLYARRMTMDIHVWDMETADNLVRMQLTSLDRPISPIS